MEFCGRELHSQKVYEQYLMMGRKVAEGGGLSTMLDEDMTL